MFMNFLLGFLILSGIACIVYLVDRYEIIKTILAFLFFLLLGIATCYLLGAGICLIFPNFIPFCSLG